MTLATHPFVRGKKVLKKTKESCPQAFTWRRRDGRGHGKLLKNKRKLSTKPHKTPSTCSWKSCREGVCNLTSSSELESFALRWQDRLLNASRRQMGVYVNMMQFFATRIISINLRGCQLSKKKNPPGLRYTHRGPSVADMALYASTNMHTKPPTLTSSHKYIYARTGLYFQNQPTVS